MTRFQKFPRQRFHITAGDGAEKDKLKHLIIRDGGGAPMDKTAAEALAVVCDIRGLFARIGRRFARFVH